MNQQLYLVAVSPLGLMFWAHLANQLLGFGSPQWIFCHDRTGITGGVDLLSWTVVCYLVGAVGAPARRRLTVKTLETQMRRYRDRTIQRPMKRGRTGVFTDPQHHLRFLPSSHLIQVLVLNAEPTDLTRT